MYTYAHPIEDALENITHSLCTLEFEDQRPFYDWLLDRLAEGGLINQPHPRQYEFARLNLTYVITSKRKLKQLVDERPRERLGRPAHAHHRRPAPPRLHAREPAAVCRAHRRDQERQLDRLQHAGRRAARRPGPEGRPRDGGAGPGEAGDHQLGRGDGRATICSTPAPPPCNPHDPEPGRREFKFGKELWIERTDYEEVPPKGYNRLFPGNKVRLKYGHVIECTGATRDAAGNVTEVQAELVPDTKSGTPGADAVKVKGVITWVAAADALKAEVRLYDRLFAVAQPDTGDKDFLEELNPDSLKVVTAYVEPSLASAKGDEKFQFERHGYFVADRKEHAG